jgi:hypothetical protein
MTPVVRKRLRQVEVLHRKEEDGSKGLIFCSRPFVLCGLPLRRQPKETLLHTRRNGKFILQVQAHPDFGLPFGQDRLIPIWVATIAVRQQSRCVRFRSGSELIEEFGLPRNGKHYRRSERQLSGDSCASPRWTRSSFAMVPARTSETRCETGPLSHLAQRGIEKPLGRV